jgi:hypothetical protein
MKFLRTIAAIFLLFGFVSSVRSGIADSAAVVVLGHITGGAQVGNSVSASLQVDKVLKGNITSGQILPLVATAQSVKGSRTLSGSGMWFLSPPKTILNSFNIVSPVHGSVPFDFLFLPTPQSQAFDSVVAAESESTNDKVAEELSRALLVTPPNQIAFTQLAKALSELPYSPTIESRLDDLVRAQTIELQIVGLAGLLRNGRTSYLINTLTLPAAPIKNHPLSAELVSAVAGTTDTSAHAVADLGTLATSPRTPAGIRTAAAASLERIHTGAALPFLMLMLSSPDENIQLSAVRGFSMFVQNLPVKTSDSIAAMSWLRPKGPAVYRSAETEKYTILTTAFSGTIGDYIGFWKTWFLANQETIP